MANHHLAPHLTPHLAPHEAALVEAIAAQGDALLARTCQWASINSGSGNMAGLAQMAEVLVDVLAGFPGLVEQVPLAPVTRISADGTAHEMPQGASLRLTVRPDAPVQVALTGHYDTVFDAAHPFQTVAPAQDGRINGPGMADMKGGISVMLGALAAVEHLPMAANLGYTVLLSPDEETGSLASAPLLKDLATRAKLGLTYEPALADGTLVSARKGSGNYHVVVRGRAAHAGRDFAAGRNAITAAARIACALDALNGKRDGVTVNVARIDGGSAPNVVPDAAVVRFNVRMPEPQDAAWVEAAIATALASGASDGITAHLHGGITRPPKPFTPGQQRLFAAFAHVGAALGQDLRWAPSGGVCEGNNLFAHGLPNIDTLGVRGGAIHSDQEFAVVESFAERAQLSALWLGRWAACGGDLGRMGAQV